MMKEFNLRVKIMSVLAGVLLLLIALSTALCGSGTSNAEKANLNTQPVLVQNTYDLPEILTEVSGIAFIGGAEFACIQDELGEIFIFNIKSNKITETIKFAGRGDYEGLALVNNDAYIIRSDGHIFEVTNFRSDNREVNEYNTSLTYGHNVEGLCFDKANSRLLIAIKDKEPGNKNYKGIYKFDVLSKIFDEEPVYKIYLNDTIFSNESEKGNKVFRPSAINIHPTTGELFVLEAVNSKLLIMNEQGVPKELFHLDRKIFRQPEGLTFDSSGDIYISNEGKSASANILKVELHRN